MRDTTEKSRQSLEESAVKNTPNEENGVVFFLFS